MATYTASKTAVEGFTESLALELRPLGIRAKLVEPGYGPDTRFGANAGSRMDGLITPPYADHARDVFAELGKVGAVTHASDVAEVVWNAAHDATHRLRYPAGADAVAAAGVR